MVKTRKSRGGRTKSKRGGNLLASVVGALKSALPSIVLYEALKVVEKRKENVVQKNAAENVVKDAVKLF